MAGHCSQVGLGWILGKTSLLLEPGGGARDVQGTCGLSIAGGVKGHWSGMS